MTETYQDLEAFLISTPKNHGIMRKFYISRDQDSRLKNIVFVVVLSLTAAPVGTSFILNFFQISVLEGYIKFSIFFSKFEFVLILLWEGGGKFFWILFTIFDTLYFE